MHHSAPSGAGPQARTGRDVAHVTGDDPRRGPASFSPDHPDPVPVRLAHASARHAPRGGAGAPAGLRFPEAPAAGARRTPGRGPRGFGALDTALDRAIEAALRHVVTEPDSAAHCGATANEAATSRLARSAAAVRMSDALDAAEALCDVMHDRLDPARLLAGKVGGG